MHGRGADFLFSVPGGAEGVRGGCKNSPTFFAKQAYGSMIYPLSNLCRCSKIPVADDLAKKDPGGSLGNRLREYVILRILYISNKKYVFWFFKQIQE